VLAGLSVLRDSCLELASAAGHHQHGDVGLGGSLSSSEPVRTRSLQQIPLLEHTSDHVLDEVTMSGSVDDRHVVLGGLEPELESKLWPPKKVGNDEVTYFHRAMSMVIPRSRSALSLSSTQAYLNEPFPISWASFSNFSIVLNARIHWNISFGERVVSK